MKRLLLLFLFVSIFGWSTDYYVDPDWAGAKSGTEAAPFTDLDGAAWGTINTALASGNVTIYYSAREAGSDVNEDTSEDIDITNKTANPTGTLTLDGKSKWNSDDVTPNWAAYTGSSMAHVDSILSQNAGHTKYSKVTIDGFNIVQDATAKAITICGDNWIVQNCDVSHDPGVGSGGPLFMIVPTADAAHEGSSSYAPALDSITITSNTIHDSYGELLYVGGGGSDPGEVGSGYPSHTNITISDNSFYDGGDLGGQGDAIDIKGGFVGLTISGNTITSMSDADTRGIVLQGTVGAETDDGLFLIDGENAGATPWEFDSIVEAGSNTIALDSDAAKHGSYGYTSTYDGTNDDAYGIKGFAEQTDIYVRAYFYVKAGFGFDAQWEAASIVGLTDGGSVELVSFQIYANSSSTGDRWRFRSELAGVADVISATSFSTGAWHYVELRFLQHSTTGGVQGWVDGNLIINDLDSDTSAQGCDEIRVGGTNDSGQDPNAADYVYVDSIKADSSAIGAFAGGAGVDQEIVIESNHIYDNINWIDAISLSNSWGNSNGVDIYNNIIDSNAAEGITVFSGSATDIGIYNNTIYNSGAEGIEHQAGNTSTIKNNVLLDNNSGGNQVNFAGTITSTHNAYSDTWGDGCTDCVAGLTTADFTDAAGGDFTPVAGSAVIGVGADLSVIFTDDYAGTTRSSWDIGAYEGRTINFLQSISLKFMVFNYLNAFMALFLVLASAKTAQLIMRWMDG